MSKYVNFLSVQTNRSFYTGVRVIGRAGFHCISSPTFLLEGLQWMVVFIVDGLYYLNNTNSGICFKRFNRFYVDLGFY